LPFLIKSASSSTPAIYKISFEGPEWLLLLLLKCHHHLYNGIGNHHVCRLYLNRVSGLSWRLCMLPTNIWQSLIRGRVQMNSWSSPTGLFPTCLQVIRRMSYMKQELLTLCDGSPSYLVSFMCCVFFCLCSVFGAQYCKYLWIVHSW
jgi:hypothetical protein